MPQTEEEHLENQNLDFEDEEKLNPDAEVSLFNFFSFFCVTIDDDDNCCNSEL